MHYFSSEIIRECVFHWPPDMHLCPLTFEPFLFTVLKGFNDTTQTKAETWLITVMSIILV